MSPDAVSPTPSSRDVRPWRTPTIVELPKLTQLTLASAIGGGGGTGGGGSTVFGLLLATGLLLGSGACALEREPTLTPEAPHGQVQLLTCHADRVAGTLGCDAPAAVPGQGVLGDQGTVIGLRSSNVSYDGGSEILSADVTVQNLTTGPIGTLDGTTLSSGVSVFFVAGPDATPTGSVQVANPTGTNGTFTGSNQTYFNYAQVLNAFEVSSAVTWEFQFAGGADAFTFTVLVAADLPSLGTIQAWNVEPGFGAPTWRGIGGWGSDGIFATGDFGMNYIHENGVWRAINDPAANFQANPGRIAVGPDGKVAMIGNDGGSNIVKHWDRSGWQTLAPPSGTPTGVAFAYNAIFVATTSSLFRRTSSGWDDIGLPAGTSSLRGAWTIGALLVVQSNNGKLWVWDEVYTEIGSPGPGQPNTGNLILFGPDTSTLWSVSDASLDPTVRFYDGSGWSNQTLPQGPSSGVYPQSGTGTSATSAFITAQGLGQGWVFHWNGSAWVTDTSVPSSFPGGIWARDDGDITMTWGHGTVAQRDGAGNWTTRLGTGGGRSTWITGDGTAFMAMSGGQLRKFNGTTWAALGHTLNNVNTVWASGPDDAWVTGFDYFIAHYSGGVITSEFMDFTIGVGVGGSGPSDVWAVGNSGTISHWDGVAWDQVQNCSVTCEMLWGVYAASPTFAVAVGSNSTILIWNGTSWSAATSPVGVNLRSVHGSSANNVWAVGEGGIIIRWNGSSWSQVSSGGATEQLNGVWAVGPNEAYAVGEGGNILRWNGSAWQFQSVAGINGSYPLKGVSVRGSRGFIAGERSFRGRY
jgi:hypothetical protein